MGLFAEGLDSGAVRARVKKQLQARGIDVRLAGRGVRSSLKAVLEFYSQRGLSPATIVDVGVANGTPGLYEPFPDARLVLVEPLVEWRSTLEQLATGGRQVDIVSAAAGRASAELNIDVHRVLELSSMVGARPHDASSPDQRSVPVKRLDDIAAELDISGPVVLKIDVEGAELEVLAGASDLLGQCELVLIELSFVELIEGAPLFGEVVAWMGAHGFVVADLYDGHNRPLDGALAMMDVAFLPIQSRFRSAVGYASPADADALYRSWGR